MIPFLGIDEITADDDDDDEGEGEDEDHDGEGGDGSLALPNNSSHYNAQRALESGNFCDQLLSSSPSSVSTSSSMNARSNADKDCQLGYRMPTAAYEGAMPPLSAANAIPTNDFIVSHLDQAITVRVCCNGPTHLTQSLSNSATTNIQSAPMGENKAHTSSIPAHHSQNHLQHSQQQIDLNHIHASRHQHRQHANQHTHEPMAIQHTGLDDNQNDFHPQLLDHDNISNRLANSNGSLPPFCTL